MQDDLLKNTRIWFMVSGLKVSGAESRAVKVASFFASQNIFKEVMFVANKELLKRYYLNKVLSELLHNTSIKVFNKNAHDGFMSLNDTINIKLLKNNLHYFFLQNKFCSNIYHKAILALSWQNFMINNIRETDIVHCIYGSPVKIAVWEMSKYIRNLVITEITSPSIINRDIHFLKAIFRNNCKSKNMHMLAVSKTNYDIYIDRMGHNFFNEHNIQIKYYEGPFVSIIGEAKKVTKENIMIFPHKFFGRKNALLFAKSVKTLFANGRLKGWKVLFRGTGQDEEMIHDILEHNLKENQVEIGYNNNIADDFAKSKICVTIISTDNVPSNSIYESLKYGNLQILSDTGDTKKILNHSDFFFCDLNEESLCEAINRATIVAESDLFEEKSESMRKFYDYMETNNLYVKKAIQLYAQENITKFVTV